MKHWSIGKRVLVAAVVPAALIAVALAWYFTYARVSDLDRELRERGAAIVRQLAPASEYGVFSGNREFLRQLTESTVREAGVTGVAIVDASHEILAASGVLPAPLPLGMTLPATPKILAESPSALLFIAPVGRSPSGGEDPFSADFTPPRRFGTDFIGAVVVEMSREPLETRKRDLIYRAAAITLIGLLIAVLLSRRLSRGVTRPILQLAETVAEIKGGQLDARASIEAGGVLRVLQDDINAMAASLEDARTHLEKRIAEATAELQRQKEVAERANRTKTQFLAAASHDLRQPIQAVGLFVSALRLHSKDEDTQHYVARIERALAGLETVLDGLLDISRLDAGVITPRIENFPLSRTFASLRDTFAATAAESGLELRVVDTTAWCRSDPLLLERILSNLVSNALRYTETGGVCLGCRRSGRDGDELRIEVWDTGIGIPKDKREEVFREFVQLENPQRQRDKGLGLGLAIVERLSRLLGHPLVLRSQPGKGTMFALVVPRAPAAAPSEPAESAAQTEHLFAGRRILVLDDDPDVLEALTLFLSQLGIIPFAASNLDEARRMIDGARGGIDLIISDYRLGGEHDGVIAVETLSAELGYELPALIISGEASEPVLQRVAESGLLLLHKPVPAETLRAALAALLVSREDAA